MSVLIKKCPQARVICDQSKMIIKTRARANALSIARTLDLCSNEIMGNWEVMPPLIILVCNDLALLPGSHVAQIKWLLCCPHCVFLCCPDSATSMLPTLWFLCCPDSVTSMLPALCFLCCPDSVTSMLPTLWFRSYVAYVAFSYAALCSYCYPDQ